MAGLVNVEALKGLGDAVGKLGTLAKDIRVAISGHEIEDPNKRLELDSKLADFEGKVAGAQAEINKINAASSDKFNSRWRPACGWLCVTGLAWSIFVYPFWVWITKLLDVPLPPEIDTAVLVSILIGMLGLGAYRTYEKRQGVQDNH